MIHLHVIYEVIFYDVDKYQNIIILDENCNFPRVMSIWIPTISSEMALTFMHVNYK